MRLSLIILAFCGLALAACSTVNQASANGTNCVRTEQRGCIEFDLLNLQHDPTHRLVQMIPPSGRFDNPSTYISTQWGPDLYKAYKRGELEAAGAQTFCVCIWNLTYQVPNANMSAYVLHDRRHTLTRHNVQEVNASQECPIAAGVGRAQRAFRISIGAGKPGAAFQLPWDAIGPNTYIMVGPVGRTVYPKRNAKAGDGFWHTPKALASARARGWSYWLRPTFQ